MHTNNNLHGIMHCNIQYSTSCIIASDKWECININICNNTCIPITTTTTSNSLNNDKHIEMIIIVCGLIIALCFITFCCWYNNKNRKQTSTNTDSNTMKNIMDGNKTTKTNEDTEYYTKLRINLKKVKNPKQNQQIIAVINMQMQIKTINQIQKR